MTFFYGNALAVDRIESGEGYVASISATVARVEGGSIFFGSVQCPPAASIITGTPDARTPSGHGYR